MKVTVIGSGYVGLVVASCLAEQGNDVQCGDLDQRRIDILNSGGVPIYEPGLKELVDRNRAAGRLRFGTDTAAGIAHGDVIFIAVGTPPDNDGSADLRHVLAVAREIGRDMTGFKVVVDKSTVPVGTGAMVSAVILEELNVRGIHDASGMFSVVANPEFLKEGAAVADFMRPDRIVIGTNDDVPGLRALRMMKTLYAPFTRNHDRIFSMDVRSAEFTKYAANAMLATRISLMNELANLADRMGADIELVRQGIGSDPRIGYAYLYAGTGYGGSCFPKDVQALMRSAREHQLSLQVLTAVEEVNNSQKLILVSKIVTAMGDDLSGKAFGMWGLAFKPNTDDMREAPSRVIIAELLRRGASIRAFDPVATGEAKRVLLMDLGAEAYSRVTFCSDQMDALYACDALVIVTEWKAFRSPDFDRVKTLLRNPLIFDGRNLYEPQVMHERGFRYFAIGRPLEGR